MNEANTKIMKKNSPAPAVLPAKGKAAKPVDVPKRKLQVLTPPTGLPKVKVSGPGAAAALIVMIFCLLAGALDAATNNPGVIGLPGTGSGSTNPPGTITIPAGTSQTRIAIQVNTNGDVIAPLNAIASTNEVDAGTSATKIVTPAQLHRVTASLITTNLEAFGGAGDGRTIISAQVANGVVTAPAGTFSASDVGKLFLQYHVLTNHLIVFGGGGPGAQQLRFTSLTNLMWNGSVYVGMSANAQLLTNKWNGSNWVLESGGAGAVTNGYTNVYTTNITGRVWGRYAPWYRTNTPTPIVQYAYSAALTTIASYNSSSSVTLTDTSINETNYALFGTDNSSAINAALNCMRFTGGVIQGNDGIYLYGTGTMRSNAVNSIVLIPPRSVNDPTNNTVTYTIRGKHNPAMTFWVKSNNVPMMTGTVFYDVTQPLDQPGTTTNAFFTSYLPENPTAVQGQGLAMERVRFENIWFRSSPNPKRTRLHWEYGGGLDVNNCTFDRDLGAGLGYVSDTAGEPVHYPPCLQDHSIFNVFDIVAPTVYNSGDFRVTDTSFSFSGNGIKTSEHTLFRNLNFTACSLPLYMQAGGLSAVSADKLFFFCDRWPIVVSADTLIAATPTVYMNVGMVGVENHDDNLDRYGFATNIITDVSNRLYGTIGALYSGGNTAQTNANGLQVFSTYDSGDGRFVPVDRFPPLKPVNVESPFASELGSRVAQSGLVLDVPFVEGSGVYARTRSKGYEQVSTSGGFNWTNVLNRTAVLVKESGNQSAIGLGDSGTTFPVQDISFNFVFNSTGPDRTNHLINPGYLGGGPYGYYLTTGISNAAIWFHYYDLPGTGKDIYANVPSGGNDGNWHMVTGVKNTNGIALYYDGALVGTNYFVVPTNTHNYNVGVGYAYDANNRQRYALNRWQIWNRPLAADEVRGLAMSEGLLKDTVNMFSTRTIAFTTAELPVGAFGTWNSNGVGLLFRSVNSNGTIVNIP